MSKYGFNVKFMDGIIDACGAVKSKTIGYTMGMIRECNPDRIEDWIKYYDETAKDKHFTKTSRPVFRKFLKEQLGSAPRPLINALMRYVGDIVYERTFDGWLRETNGAKDLSSIVARITGYNDAKVEIDEKYDSRGIDAILTKGQKQFKGIQPIFSIKPESNGISINKHIEIVENNRIKKYRLITAFVEGGKVINIEEVEHELRGLM